MSVVEFLFLASVILLVVASLFFVVMLVRDKFLVDSPFSATAWVIYFVALAYSCAVLSICGDIIERVFKGCV